GHAAGLPPREVGGEEATDPVPPLLGGGAAGGRAPVRKKPVDSPTQRVRVAHFSRRNDDLRRQGLREADNRCVWEGDAIAERTEACLATRGRMDKVYQSVTGTARLRFRVFDLVHCPPARCARPFAGRGV